MLLRTVHLKWLALGFQATKEEAKAEEAEKEKLCEMKQHKKILDKGKPDDVMPGRKNATVSLTGEC